MPPPSNPGAIDPARPTDRTYRDYALSADAGATDPEHPLNANLRDNGVGLTPRAAGSDAERRCTTVACGSIMSFVTIPFGWHVFDDGRRALVFTPDSAVHIEFRLLRRDGRDDPAMIERFIADLSAHPGVQWLKLDLGGMASLALRQVPIGNDMAEQVHMLKACPFDPDLVLCISTTTAMGRMSDTLDLVEIMLRDFRFASESAPPGA